MITAEQNRLMLRSAERLVAQEMGVDPDDNAGLSREQRAEFNHRLAEKILQYPAVFTAETLETARRVVARTYEPLDDASFSVADFASETVRPGIDAAKSVGQGVLTTVNAAKWAIPLAAAGCAVVLFLAFRERVKS